MCDELHHVWYDVNGLHWCSKTLLFSVIRFDIVICNKVDHYFLYILVICLIVCVIICWCSCIIISYFLNFLMKCLCTYYSAHKYEEYKTTLTTWIRYKLFICNVCIHVYIIFESEVSVSQSISKVRFMYLYKLYGQKFDILLCLSCNHLLQMEWMINGGARLLKL